MRGAQLPGGVPVTGMRIIPADAGNTSIILPLLMLLADHPRGCGEHAIGWLTYSCRWGSSPRMRGTLSDQLVGDAGCRIIPADAGSTTMPLPPMRSDRDHPRGCGEHLQQRYRATDRQGSSPRMRGALGLLEKHDTGAGIIPADAGSTVVQAGPLVDRQDHPRGCGEHLSLRFLFIPELGSSPRMRGALVDHGHDLRVARIIPAEAGSTTRSNGAPRPRGDHPRGCGEHSGLLRVAIRLSGSSPRMRGAPRHLQTGDHPGGIIPADAGNTTSCFAPLTFDQDHPRGCGEHRQ